MPELDAFEIRLAAAIHAFADRAETRVDAMDTATRAIGHRRFARIIWFGRWLPLPVAFLLVLGLLLALLAWTVQVGGPKDDRTSIVPLIARTAAPTEGPSPSVTPVPSTDGAGDEYVIGTETTSVTMGGTDEWVGKVEQIRGRLLSTVDTMNDPRVSGTGTVQLNGDGYGTQFNGSFEGSVGSAWGSYRLENAAGAWEGTWTGVVWNSGPTDLSGWLVGSGAYEGYTYYFHLRGSTTLYVDGVIFPGSPPTP